MWLKFDHRHHFQIISNNYRCITFQSVTLPSRCLVSHRQDYESLHQSRHDACKLPPNTSQLSVDADKRQASRTQPECIPSRQPKLLRLGSIIWTDSEAGDGTIVMAQLMSPSTRCRWYITTQQTTSSQQNSNIKMPLWVIYHPEGTFTTEESRKSLAADVTTIYTSAGLPAFYVIVNFITLPNSHTFVGGENPPADKPFIRITMDHIAIHTVDDPERALSLVTRVDKILKPHIADKGYNWEFHIDNTPRELWKINGFIPPPREFYRCCRGIGPELTLMDE
ncbi:putative oxalocrotonate tautomerase enzyme-domain-containing protein [Bombardia bombarda]|uniref:Oxalocrotonate tautomerase enzyme-domain-containing protein n=1 Tax=Bombardia bombarda TaxID=252184 RepID=A0AA40CB61_9PEZI|nr:putative oxalocrotonate tautomerase enzyme-domain-containing protein [Bombardia bombarda]